MVLLLLQLTEVDSHYAIGATYVTDLGDTAVTIGAGYSESEGSKTGTATN